MINNNPVAKIPVIVLLFNKSALMAPGETTLITDKNDPKIMIRLAILKNHEITLEYASKI